MALSYGLTNPAAFRGQFEIYPDLFKFYTVVPTRSTESTAANQRRPVLYTSLSGGGGWKYESQTSSNDFYHANYSGNFYFDANSSSLIALAHKSASSSYDAYKARCGINQAIILGMQNWDTSDPVSYSVTNQPNRQMCKSIGSSRYFCIRQGGGLVYNDNAWSTANWTTTNNFGISGVKLGDDGGFKNICMNPEKDHEALVYFVTNDSNEYLRICLCNPDNLTMIKDYTSVIFESTTLKRADYKYLSIDYSPYIGGYILFYNRSGNTRICRRILYTKDPSTGTPYAQNDYQGTGQHAFGPSGTQLVQYGSHGWYCPWTEEYFIVGSANAVFWTKNGTDWYMSQSRTSASTSAACQKFLTDGTNMIIATSGSAYYYSRDKGTTWNSGTSLSPDGFNTARSNDTIVLPFKCTNNIGINTNNITLGEFYGGNGNIGTLATNFRLNEYISVDANTNYVFYGKNKETGKISHSNRISFYDSNYIFISRIDSNSQVSKGANTHFPVIATAPSNAAYARICCRLDDSSAAVTQEMVDACEWYFAKESDFKVMTNYGDIVVN